MEMKKLMVLLVSVLLLVLTIGTIGCGGGEEAGSTPTPEPTTPADFTTYTSEGLFSISYPPDWTPATSVMGELWEEVKEQMESEVPGVSLGDAEMLFLAGIPTEEGYYPNIGIVVESRSPGYRTLNEVVEANDAFDREYTTGYQVLSQVKTTIDEREAVVIDSVDDEPGFGKWRYIQMFMVKDKFAWMVIGSAEFDDFKHYEDTFYDIARSFRILK